MKKTTSVLVATMLGLAALAATSAVPAADRPVPSFAGPLRVHPDNPRYFTDDTGYAVYLTGAPDGPSAKTRAAMGHTLQYAQKTDLAAMTPHGDLTSTKYCLAAPGKEYLVYQPSKGPFEVQFSGSKNTTFAVEWFDPQAGTVVDGKPVKMMEQTTFAPPFSGNAVLYLKAR